MEDFRVDVRSSMDLFNPVKDNANKKKWERGLTMEVPEKLQISLA